MSERKTLQELIADRQRHRRERQHAAGRAKRFSARAVKAKATAAHHRRLARRRAGQIERRQRPHGAAAAVKWALAQVGTVESPWGSNWGGKITGWIQATGYTFPVPWCQCFANAVAVAGGASQLKTGYTPYVLAGTGGYRPVSEADARPGDFVFFKFPGISSATCDHVGVLTAKPAGGVVRTVEGNTSSGTAGSQNNGGGVYQRVRPTSTVAGYVRPPYTR